VLKDESSRKIYVKIEKDSSISSVVLRFDKSEVSSKVNYRIYSLSDKRQLLKTGEIT